MAKKPPDPKARTLGRPKSDSPRKNVISFRLTDAEHAALLAYRDKLGFVSLTPRDVARDAVIAVLRMEKFLPPAGRAASNLHQTKP